MDGPHQTGALFAAERKEAPQPGDGRWPLQPAGITVRDFGQACGDLGLTNLRVATGWSIPRKDVAVMRKLTLRDILATLTVAAVVVPFIGYSVRGSMPLVRDPRGMAGIGIAGCLLTFTAFGRDALGTGAFERFMVTLGVLTLGSGMAALIAETSWALLVPMVAGPVIIWAADLWRPRRSARPSASAVRCP